jgi:hypothetical protein
MILATNTHAGARARITTAGANCLHLADKADLGTQPKQVFP